MEEKETVRIDKFVVPYNLKLKRRPVVHNSADAFTTVSEFQGSEFAQSDDNVFVLYLNSHDESLGVHGYVYKGMEKSTRVIERIVESAKGANAHAIVIAHHYPEDLRSFIYFEDSWLFKEIRQRADESFEVLDLLVLSKSAYFSYRDAGLI